MDKLKNVTLTKTDTCLTYVLKRSGLDPYLCGYENFHEFFDQYSFARYQNRLQVGDIFLWSKL